MSIEAQKADAPGDRMTEIVTRLETAPVVVDRVTANGRHAEYVDLLEDDVANLPWPAYVVVVDRMPGDGLPERPDELATVLHDRIGEDGLYIVGIDGNVDVIAPGLTDVDDVDLSLATIDLARPDVVSVPFADPEHSWYAPPAQAHFIATLATVVGTEHESDAAVAAVDALSAEVRTDPMFVAREPDLIAMGDGFRTEQPSDVSGGVLVAVMVGVLVTLATRRFLSWRSAVANDPRLRGRSRRPERPRPQKARGTGAESAGPTPSTVNRAKILRDLRAVGEIPRRSDGDIDPLVAMHWPAIARDVEAAELLADSPDIGDAVGAAVFARRARRDADQVRAGRPPAEPEPICYFDPLHTSGTGSAALTDALRVPACDACARAVEAGKAPDTVIVERRGKPVPYYERDDVWSRTGFGSVSDDAADLVLAGARGGRKVPKAVRR